MGGESRQALIPAELADHVARKTGVDLERGGLDATFSDFVRKRCRALGQTPAAYARAVLAGDRDEERILLSAISVPHTWFFRDRLQLELALEYAGRALAVPRPVRVWVPGCATGEDVYSISVLGLMRKMDVSVLGTDISPHALESARQATYDAASFRDFPTDVAAYFRETGGKRSPEPEVRQKVAFEWQNLMDPARTVAGGWDLIVCRNVVIYFSKGAALDCAERLGEALSPKGLLVLGAGELAAESPKGLEPTIVGTRVMLKRASGAPPPPPLPPLPAAGASPPPPRPAAATPRPEAPDPFAALLQAGDLAAAELDLERMAGLHPRSAHVRLCLGIVHFARADYGQAVDALDRAMESDRSLWPAALYKGLCLERLDRLGNAEFQRARELLSAASDTRSALPIQFAALAAELLELALERTGQA